MVGPMDYCPTFADEIVATLEAADYEILDDHRDDESRPTRIFVAKCNKPHQGVTLHAVVSFKDGWDVQVTENAGNGSIRTTEVARFGYDGSGSDELREIIEAPWPA